MKIFVSVVDTEGKKLTFPLREKPIIIGRSSKAHVTISDELASGTHCLIYVKERCVFIEDYKSKNGIYLNGIKVLKQRIYLEDKIRIGGSFLYFEHNKLDDACKKLLTPKGEGNKAERELTLEIDKSQKNFGTKRKIDDKLYEGVEETNKKIKKPKVNTTVLFIREQTANLVDFALTALITCIPFLGYYYLDKEMFKKIFLKDNAVNIDALSSDLALYMFGGSLVLAFFFYRFNRKKRSRSIGEALMGLD